MGISSISFRVVLLVGISLFAALSTGVAQHIPEFTYLEHPTHTRNRVRANPTPVVVRKYHLRSRLDRLTSEDAIFVPGGASYDYVHATGAFASGADVLASHAQTMKTGVNDADYMTVYLNYGARVFALLELNSAPGDATPLTLVGAPSDWVVHAVVQTNAAADVALGDTARWGSAPRPVLRQYAVAVEVPILPDNSVVLPHPRALQVAGRVPVGLTVVFGIAGAADLPLTAHPAPAIPGSHNGYTENVRHTPSTDPPVPNRSCPKWLHDAYVVRDSSTRLYWLTWHPMIDPVYWCYFDHEHGAYPGRYRPKFHYTASLTPDPSSPTGVQQESHNGFKVLTFMLDDGHVAVLLLHAHNSRARRFVTRHHTFGIAVFEPRASRWALRIELYMKMDFGFLEGLLAGPDGPIDGDGEAIRQELENGSGQKASLQVYTYNPANPDPFFWTSADPFKGRYEEWRGPLNCALNVDRWYNSGLKFEFHNQQTAMKCADCSAVCACSSRGADDNLTVLKGHGMHRSIVFVAAAGSAPGETHQRVELSEAHCLFNGEPIPDRAADGVFYTNAYFNETLPPTDPLAVRQVFKRNLSPIVVGGHRAVTNDDPWSHTMSYAGNMVRRNFNTEMAVKVLEN